MKPRIRVKQVDDRFEYDYTLYENPFNEDVIANEFMYQVDVGGFDFELAVYAILVLAFISASTYLFYLEVIA